MKGYKSVKMSFILQISPPSESIVVTNPWHPWWQRYQPISYNLCSRSGTEEELKDMVTRCNNVGVMQKNILSFLQKKTWQLWLPE